MVHPDAEGRIERLQRRDKPIPDDLIGPELLPGYEDWLLAFNELGTDRQIGEVTGPIPAASIYRHTQGWDAGEKAMFRRIIRAMDAVFLGVVNKIKPRDDQEDDGNSARDTFRSGLRG